MTDVDAAAERAKKRARKMKMGGKKKMMMGGKKMYQSGGFIEPGVFDLDRD